MEILRRAFLVCLVLATVFLIPTTNGDPERAFKRSGIALAFSILFRSQQLVFLPLFFALVTTLSDSPHLGRSLRVAFKRMIVPSVWAVGLMILNTLADITIFKDFMAYFRYNTQIKEGASLWSTYADSWRWLHPLPDSLWIIAGFVFCMVAHSLVNGSKMRRTPVRLALLLLGSLISLYVLQIPILTEVYYPRTILTSFLIPEMIALMLLVDLKRQT